MNVIQTGVADPPISGVLLVGLVVVGAVLVVAAGAIVRLAVAELRRQSSGETVATGTAFLILVLAEAWIVVTFGLLVVLDLLSFDLFIIVVVVGYFVTEFLMSPPQANARWWSGYRMLRIPAMLVFAYFVFRRVTAVL